MGTKETLLSLLNGQRGTYYSGEELASRLGVSRTAVWKAVKSLRGDGYEITAVQNKGYSLAETTDILSAEGIRRYLEPICDFLMPEIYGCVTSTNSLLREKANSGTKEGCVVIAGSQSAGRGRLGRHFYSPADTGLYLSLLLRPTDYSPAQAVKVTTMAAAAACLAIEEVSGRSAGIKWVNDIYMNGRKVCGILTEGSFDLESGGLDHIVLGVGINAYSPREGFPEELTEIAGSVFTEQQNDGKNRLAAAFLNRFVGYYRGKNSEVYADTYREKSLVIGKAIQVISPAGSREATALDVDRDCRLIVRYTDGSVEALSSGEVSIRKL